MCGIVGIFLKNPKLEPKLGTMLSGMLGVMCDRGPDSAGFAVYGSGDSGHLKLTLRSGTRMEMYKEVGLPTDVAARFHLDEMQGTHGIGHTRMATESAVTTNGAHPYSTGADQCLVHNGSLSNHNALRRELIREGLSFQTQNDTEVAAGYMSWRMQQGDSLEQTLNSSLGALDRFYTFAAGTH